MFTGLMIIVHVLVCMALILIILLQTGKGAGMGAAFGGASSTLFGATGRATFLTKITIAAAVIFGITSLGLSFLSTTKTGVMDNYKPSEQTAPKTPEIPPLPELPTGEGANVPVTIPMNPVGAPASGDEAMPPDLPVLPETAPGEGAPEKSPPASEQPSSEGSSPAAPLK